MRQVPGVRAGVWVPVPRRRVRTVHLRERSELRALSGRAQVLRGHAAGQFGAARAVRGFGAPRGSRRRGRGCAFREGFRSWR